MTRRALGGGGDQLAGLAAQRRVQPASLGLVRQSIAFLALETLSLGDGLHGWRLESGMGLAWVVVWAGCGQGRAS